MRAYEMEKLLNAWDGKDKKEQPLNNGSTKKTLNNDTIKIYYPSPISNNKKCKINNIINCALKTHSLINVTLINIYNLLNKKLTKKEMF